MRTKSLDRRKVHVVTLGCSKNLVDSEALMGQLRAGGLSVDHDADGSDAAVVVINTCGFVEDAKKESIDAILRFAEAKRKGLVERVLVTGCLSERYRDDLAKEIPEVDEFFGTRELPRLLKSLGADFKRELVGERLLSTPRHYAYFKVSEGCDRPCSFCAIPLMRGGHVSRPIEELEAEARRLAAAGTKELLLIAQDSTYYGLDLYGKRRLADLLKVLSDVEGLAWIRLHYAFPAGFPMDALAVMAERPNICKYLDMPLQHCEDELLASMRRGITRAKTDALIAEIRARVPGISLRTTLIAGYPGETRAHHEAMLAWVERTRFDRLGVFAYSHEEGTGAHALEDGVPKKEKRRRAEAVMAVQRPISLSLNQAKVGRTLRALVDYREGGWCFARGEADSPEVDNEIRVDARRHPLPVGEFADLKITSAEEYDLFAEPAGPPAAAPSRRARKAS